MSRLYVTAVAIGLVLVVLILVIPAFIAPDAGHQLGHGERREVLVSTTTATPNGCSDLMELHAGKAAPPRQEWFNHLDAKGYARFWIACTEQWGTAEWECLEQLWDEESSWRHDIRSGIPQAMPESKMGDPNQGGGPDYRTNPRTQVRWGTTYIAARYGAPTSTPRRCHAGY